MALAWAFARTARRRGGRAARPTRPSAARSSSPPSAPPRGRWSGSRGSRATSTSRGCSSRSTCSPAAAASPTTTCACATRRSWPTSTTRSPIAAAARARPPMFAPLRLRGLELPNRVVVSPMDMYSAVDGTPATSTWCTRRAARSAAPALVMTEMICVSTDGRITPGCAGMYRAEHVAAWRRIVDFVHAPRRLRDGAQLGHSGRKGSTKLMWQGIDEPLAERQLGGDRARRRSPYSELNQVPREMTRADMDAVRDQFVAATRGARRGRVRPARAALRPRLPAVQLPLAAHQPRAPTSTAARWRAGRASRSRCSTRAARYGRRTSR